MKALVWSARIIVGLLFIFSGLVKANDPLGLSYKMQEFFEIWGWHSLNDHTLLSSVLMNAFEIIAGFALLLGWRVKLFTWLLLIMIVFFTFLTGYTYVTGKPANCGCFGDCLPITSKTSFLKDVVLTILIAFLVWKHKYIQPVLTPKLRLIIMGMVTVFSFGLQWYALTYLPPVDCLPFKKGNSIPEKMQPPANAIPDSFAIRFVYEKDGKRFEFAPSELPANLGEYTYVSREDKLVRKGNADPKIKGFRLSDAENNDRTTEVLSQPQALILFIEHFDDVPFSKWSDELKKIHQLAIQKQTPLYVVARFADDVKAKLASAGMGDLEVFTADVVAIHTAARTNPCLYLLRNGVIIDKQGYKRFGDISAALSK